jgi:hypothetical protein
VLSACHKNLVAVQLVTWSAQQLPACHVT